MRVRHTLSVMSALFLAATVWLFASPAFAQDDAYDGAAAEIDIPMTETYVTATPGDIVQVGSTAVDAALRGRTCQVVATITNQSSIHAGNTLVVTSGDSSVSLADIEDAADTTITRGGTITLGETITAAVVLGPDGATSLGPSMSLACATLPVTPPAPGAPVTPEPITPVTPIAPAVPAPPVAPAAPASPMAPAPAVPQPPVAPAVPAGPAPTTPIAPAVPATPVQAIPTYTG